MKTELVYLDIELIKIKHLSRLRHLEFLMLLEQMKYKLLIKQDELRKEELFKRLSRSHKIFSYNPVNFSNKYV